MKFLAEICNGRNQAEVEEENGPYPIFGSGGEFGRAKEFIHAEVSVLLGRKGTIDKPLLVREPFWTVDTMFYTKISKGVNPSFFFYLCKTIPFDFHRDQTTLPSMTQTGLSEIIFPVAPIDEQEKIAAFLDWKTGQVDALIAKKQTLIEKLKEKRLAVITQAVTKGLDSSAELRDSGISWLGLVPKHWEIKRLRFATEKIEQGWSPQCDNEPAGDEAWGVMKVGCVSV